MRHLSSTSLLLLALVLLCGCGGGADQGATRAPAGSGGVTSPSPSAGPNIAGNWQFTMTSTVSGAPRLMIAGSISPSGSSVRGVVHVNGSNCFDPLSKMDLTGTLSGSNLSLTSTPVAGQVATLTGNISDDPITATRLPEQFTGTYVIKGGCAGGDEGNFTGLKVSSMTGNWGGNLTAETGDFNRLAVALAQGTATADGSFGLTGTASFEAGTCFKTARIASRTFPSGSYVMGNSVSLELETDNGVIVFQGTAEEDGLIRGNYTVSGSTCESTGTGYLSPWEY